MQQGDLSLTLAIAEAVIVRHRKSIHKGEIKMKRKTAVFLSIVVFAVLVATACSNSSQKKEEIPNPMVRYDTMDQIEKKIGYSPAVLQLLGL